MYIKSETLVMHDALAVTWPFAGQVSSGHMIITMWMCGCAGHTHTDTHTAMCEITRFSNNMPDAVWRWMDSGVCSLDGLLSGSVRHRDHG